MEFYLEAQEVLPEDILETALPQFVRLQVADEKEAVDLANSIRGKLTRTLFAIELHEHDHKTPMPCNVRDLRPKMHLNALEVELRNAKGY